MNNMIHVHVEKKDKFELIESITNEENYNVLYIGEEVRVFTVSYTHLRAHETSRNLVCRLML